MLATPESVKTPIQIESGNAAAVAAPPLASAGKPNSAADLLGEARTAFNAGDHATSEERLLAALTAGADETTCRRHLARVYNLREEWLKALEQWLWLRDQESGQLEPLLQVARAQFRLGRKPEAAAGFRAVLGLAPDHVEARQRILEIEASGLIDQGRAAFNVADYVRGEQSFLAALRAGADEAVCRLYLARIYNLGKDWSKALEQWRWLRDRDPAQLEPRLQVARAQFRLRRYSEATAGFEAVLGLAPDHAEARQRLWDIKAQHEEAPMLGALADTSAEVPASAAALFDEGRVAFNAEDYTTSEGRFQAALHAGADEAVCRLYLARIYNLCKDWGKALEQWVWLRDQDPGRLEPQLQVARAQFRLGRYLEAKAGFEAVLALAADHVEAHKRLLELKALREGAANIRSEASAEEPNAAMALFDEGRAAFKTGDHVGSAESFLAALRAGADEAGCRLHLARIYNLEEEWPKALAEWKWLRDRDPGMMEPHLQVARGQFRAGRYAESAAEFRAVLALAPGHVEAQQTLQKIEAIQEQDAFPADAIDGQNWLSLVPANLRWRLSADLLGAGIGAVEALIDLATRHTSVLTDLVSAYGEADGELNGHRQLYALQAIARIDELAAQLKNAKRTVRTLTKRTEKIYDTFSKFTGHEISASPTVKQPLPRAMWRETLVKLAADVYRAHGLNAALSWLFREALVEDRSTVLADLGTAVREVDRNAAIRLYWLSYGVNRSPALAERLASRMFQAGDLSNSGALVKAAPMSTSSPFIMEMRSSGSMFREGIKIPPAAEMDMNGNRGRLAYVASGSLPFQVAGYTIRTHQLLTGLANAGVDCVCFTRPGYPWDRPRAIASGVVVAERHTVGNVAYVHTPLPEAARNPETLVEEASCVLERQFRAQGIGIVQAASNSRNALPALIAARRVGAMFIYEVRGLWELTAASRFTRWEETERYKLDRHLEVLVASHADHVLTITNGVAEELVNGGVSRERLSLLPNAVDPEAFKPVAKDPTLMARHGLRDDDFIMVYGESLTMYEGLDDLIVALSLMKQGGLRPKLIIAGGGDARTELEAVSAEYKMMDEVTFTGRVTPDEIHAYLSLADVVAIPRKPFKVCEVVTPLKPFEAMSMEKAVVLSDLPALREIVADEQTGLICKPADPGDLAAVLTRLAKDPALRTRLGRAARQWIIAQRSWSINASNLMGLYRSLGGNSPLPRQPDRGLREDGPLFASALPKGRKSAIGRSMAKQDR